MSNAQRIGVLVAAVVALAVAFVVLSGDDDDDVTADTVPAKVDPATTPAGTTSTPATTTAKEPEPEPTAQVVEVRDAKPVDGVQRIEAQKGERVRFVVRSSDTTDEIHLHGYDIAKDLKAGGKATFSFKADAEGIFEVELESIGVQIAELRVSPG